MKHLIFLTPGYGNIELFALEKTLKIKPKCKPKTLYKSNSLNFTVSCRERKSIAFPGAAEMYMPGMISWQQNNQGNIWQQVGSSRGLSLDVSCLTCGWLAKQRRATVTLADDGKLGKRRRLSICARAIHRYQNWQEEWAKRNPIKFSKDKRDYHSCLALFRPHMGPASRLWSTSQDGNWKYRTNSWKATMGVGVERSPW